MNRSWTFGQKVGAGFAVMILLAALIAAISVYALNAAISGKDRVISVNAQSLIDAGKLALAIESIVATSRGYLLAPDADRLEQMKANRSNFSTLLASLNRQVVADENRSSLEKIERLAESHQEALDRILTMRRTETSIDPVVKAFEEQVVPRRHALDFELTTFIKLEEQVLLREKQASTDAATTAEMAVVGIGIVAVMFAVVVAFFLTRTLGRQIGGAVQHIQNSSAELQAAASQQATGAKEQATAMNEIATTIGELLATSRQIAESAQRVANIAEQTANSARSGDQTVQKGQDSVSSIKRQVDLIVTHMLELGRKSQQIGGVLEIINELAEQTNILAINATIEAAGAGEAGKRFGIVADEIRKLADRVGGSTKEIRTLIDETRAAVNTTVMTTEGGAKAVETGAKQFAEVATAFRQIADLIKTATEAAREIELSTKQQATAVQQVNAAISDAAQSTKETEASSSQTAQTATQLTHLSKDLSRFVQPQTVS